MFQATDRPSAEVDWQWRTIVFTDIAGSTRQLEDIGAVAWAGVIGRHRRSIESIARRHTGQLEGFMGDGFMIVFDRANDGVSFALRLQYALAAQAELAVRIGVSSGQVLRLPSEDYVGICVNRAARLCDSCEPGGVLIESVAYETAGAELALPLLPMHELSLKGCSALASVRVAQPLHEGWLP